MDEIMDELPGTKVVFVRWNAGPFKLNNKSIKIGMEERLHKLKEVIQAICVNKDFGDGNTMVNYMFYSDDNPVITDRHPHVLLC